MVHRRDERALETIRFESCLHLRLDPPGRIEVLSRCEDRAADMI